MRDNGHSTEVANLMDGEWSCYGGGQFNGGRIGMLQFNGGRMVMLRSGQFKEGRMVVIEVASNGGGMVMLERWPVQWRKNGHVTEVVSFMEG